MTLTLVREPSSINKTFGVLFLDGYFECFTLENTKKIIPAGTYELEKYASPKNKAFVPLLKNVTDRSMIEIHVANYYYELEGCIAVGKSFDTILHYSQKAFDSLMAQLKFPATIKIKEWCDE